MLVMTNEIFMLGAEKSDCDLISETRIAHETKKSAAPLKNKREELVWARKNTLA